MKVDKVIKRIEYLRTEIAHEGFWDGYALEGMKEELTEFIEPHLDYINQLKENAETDED